jgi:Kef-type K+ transport system membrane component KefB
MPIVPPLTGHPLLVFLLQVCSLLGLALLLGRLAARLRMPAIAGELAAGVVLGPSVLAQVAPAVSEWLLPQNQDSMSLLDALGQVGVLLLVAVTGMHVDLTVVRRNAATAVKVSAAGLLVPLGLGVGAGFLVPPVLRTGTAPTIVFALFLGVAMCVSAIPVIAKTLIDMNLVHRNIGQLILIAGTLDDAVGWLLLSVVVALATTGLQAAGVIYSVTALLGVVLVMATLGRYVVRRVMQHAVRSGDRAVPITVAVVLVILCASVTHALKLEAVLGAFICGILLNTCRDLAPGWVAPLRTVVLSVLAPLFFATAGLRMDLAALAQPEIGLTALALIVLAIAGKFGGAAVGAALSRLGRWEAIALGAGMNARGVVQIIIASVGLTAGILNAEMYTIIVLVALVTSVMAAPVLRFASNRIRYTAEEERRGQEQMRMAEAHI